MKFNSNYRLSVLIAVILVLVTTSLSAQVTIGADLPPREGTLLDLKEIDTSGNVLANSSKGMLMPRVALIDLTDLSPLVVAATEEIKSQSTGMIVYNITENSSKNLTTGLVIWDGTKWVPLAVCDGNTPVTAEFTVISTTVKGTYMKGIELTPLNYLTIVLDVSVAGKYVITGTTTNGYDFLLTGEFPSTGTNIINVPGSGTPTQSTNDLGGAADVIQVKVNNTGPTATTNTVLDKPLDYLVDCNSLTVNGTYITGTTLNTSTNNLTVQGMATPASTGGMYDIGTGTVNGYQFKSTGLLTGGNQTFTINPATLSETPLVQGTNNFMLTTNSTLSPVTCPFSVWVVNPAMSIMIGNIVYTDYPASMVSISQNTANYGPTGLYNKIEKYTATSNSALADIRTNLTNRSTDVIIMNYSMQFTASDSTNIINYVKSGRYVIYSTDGLSTDQTNLVKGILANLTGATPAQVLVLATDNSATMANVADLPDHYKSIIQTTAFGNASGLSFPIDGGSNWGVAIDPAASQTVRDKFIPLNYIAGNTSYARIFIVEDPVSRGAFVFIGDGGAWSYLNNAGNEAKLILFRNLLAWFADRKYSL